MADITPARKLFDLLVSRDFDPEMLDVSGKPAPNPAEAELFSFDFRAHSGKDYGTVVVMLGDNNNFDVYFGDNVGKTMEGQDKTDWFNFLHQLKNFAVKNFMTFSPRNINRLRYSMQGQAAIKEGLFESWQGKKDVSYNAGPNQARLMIKHKRSLGEGEARFRYVESLFIETAEQERYKLPFKNLTAGKAMLEHVRNGGKPYDARGCHISEIVNELNVLNRFKRANHGKIFEGDTAQLIEQTNAYYESAQKTLKSLSTHRGYSAYFESWNPADVTDEEVVIEGLKHLFVTQSIDTRIESALPLLAKIQQQGTAMKEANIFEAWAERLLEGTWQTPDTPEKQTALLELMSQEQPVGADATNITEQLYGLLGDDHLFDQLQELADRDPNADGRQVILDRMQELSDDPNIRKVIEQLNIDANAEMNPPEGTPADLADNPPDISGEVPSVQGNVNRLAEDSLNAIRRAAGLVEGRLMDEDRSSLEHILNRFKHEVKNFEENGELDQDLYHALFDYYCDSGEMPYGTAKARDGDPYEWVAQNLESHLSGGGIVGGNPDEDFGIEREDVMQGDFAEERAPHSVDGGMENPLVTDEGIGGGIGGAGIGALAGGAAFGLPGAIAGGLLGGALGDKATDESEETDEGVAGALGGAGLGAIAGGALGGMAGGSDASVLAGGAAGGLLGGALGDKATDEGQVHSIPALVGKATAATAKQGYDDAKEIGDTLVGKTDEGWKGQLAGGTAGSLAGELAGAPLGPLGIMAGGALGGTAGQMIGDKLGGKDKEETDEDTSPLKGKYGHSGKMKAVAKDLSFLDRLKELSGLKK